MGNTMNTSGSNPGVAADPKTLVQVDTVHRDQTALHDEEHKPRGEHHAVEVQQERQRPTVIKPPVKIGRTETGDRGQQ